MIEFLPICHTVPGALVQMGSSHFKDKNTLLGSIRGLCDFFFSERLGPQWGALVVRTVTMVPCNFCLDTLFRKHTREVHCTVVFFDEFYYRLNFEIRIRFKRKKLVK